MNLRRLKLPVIALLHHGGYYPRKLRRCGRDRAFVLVYHRVGAPAGGRTLDTWRAGFEQGVSAANFDSHMRFIREIMNPLPLAELAEVVRRGAPFPPGAVAVTFDDGYRDNYTQAYPILRKYGIPATIFVATGYVESRETLWWDQVYELFRRTASRQLDLRQVAPLRDRVASLPRTTRDLSSPLQRTYSANHVVRLMEFGPPERIADTVRALGEVLEVRREDVEGLDLMLGWEEIREMSGNGISIQSHTHTHPFLSRLGPDRVEDELALSKRLIEERTGGEVDGIAYPGGRGGMFGAETIDIARRLGYRYGCTIDETVATSRSDVFAIRRQSVPDGSDAVLAYKLQCACRHRPA